MEDRAERRDDHYDNDDDDGEREGDAASMCSSRRLDGDYISSSSRVEEDPGHIDQASARTWRCVL